MAKTANTTTTKADLRIRRYFTTAGVHPYDEIEWDLRDAVIQNYKTGEVAFEQKGVEVPKRWSQNATNIAAQKYFRGSLGTPERERSVKQMIDRVVGRYHEEGIARGYFADQDEADTFKDELTHLLVNQKAAFNSPVWFNVGWRPQPQVSACFILSVEDEMKSILNWYVEEGLIFKHGSGSGINLSNLRSSKERLKSGGTASGPVSFMRGADASAGTIKSGGATRRAAKMVVLNVDHPDIKDFIWCKALEENKARALRDAGFDMDLDGRDGHSIQYQNANNSVRVTDEFMQAVIDDKDWDLKAVTTGETIETLKARELFREISQAAWECADPGLQYDTTINDWHTCSNTGRINASNPCSEYVHVDNSSCNLSSLNLLKFVDDNDNFDIEGYKHAVEIMFLAQEISVGFASYPTDKIAENSHRMRQLGQGYANLGALLMIQGLPYDSDEGRAWAAALTAIMTGHCYATSARIAKRVGPYDAYAENREPHNRVMRKHREAAYAIPEGFAPAGLVEAARDVWDHAVELGDAHGYRNAQATVLAPTGCLVGGTLVPTERGLVRLGSLGDPDGEQWQDLGVSVNTDEGPRTATQFYVNGLESVVTVETHRGYQIKGTPKHRIKVVDRKTGEWVWKRFAELEPDDLVPLALNQLIGEPQDVKLPPLAQAYWTGESHAQAPRQMTPELAEFVGYFMGDGSLHARGIRLCVDAKDFDVVERLRILGKELFNLEPHVSEQGGYTEVAFHSVRLVEWWEACGFARLAPAEGHTGKGWLPHIPNAVLHSNDREVYAAFLRGLFEADGTVNQNAYPSWSTTSIDFSYDIQSLLLALGFPTTRKFDVTGWGRSKLAVLRLLNTAYNAQWLEVIGFMSDRKNSAVAPKSSQQSARKDKIPVTRELIDRLTPDNDRMRKVLLMEHNREGMVSRRIATELLNRAEDQELRHLLSFFYDRVVSAELGEEELTYDLSVPDDVTYIANGFVSHNTIGLLMDCDTTGIEPDLALKKTKKLVGGGTMSIVNQSVPRALRKLGYTKEQVADIVAYIDENGHVIDAPHLREEHVSVFDTAMGERSIHYMGHIKMMSAVQPFLSGAISKTVNLPENASVEEIEQAYIEGWQLGLKALAIYRDNCKAAQPLSISKKSDKAVPVTIPTGQPVRQRLPKKRNSKTFKFRVADTEGYITSGEFADGSVGEIFLRVAKQGSTLAGIMDAFAISISMGLQYGVPLSAYVKQFVNTRFEPSGMTDDPDFRIATSILDYVFRLLALEYLTPEERHALGIRTAGERQSEIESKLDPNATGNGNPNGNGKDKAEEGVIVLGPVAGASAGSLPFCGQCGVQMLPSGSCFACPSCGSTSGCS